MKDKGIADYISLLLGMAGRIIREEKENLISKDDLQRISYGQFQFIDAIADEEKSTISSLAKKMKITKPSVTVAIQKLENSGLVFKKKSEIDKRISYIYLTDKGLLLKQAEKNALNRVEKLLTSKLDKDEYNTLISILSKYFK